MGLVEFRRWRFLSNREATVNAYERAAREEQICRCLYCRNYYAGGAVSYPAKVLDLYQDLGIDGGFPSEVMHLRRIALGGHLYGGWFHFVGSIESGPDARRRVAATAEAIDLEAVDSAFRIGFTAEPSIYFRAFLGKPLVQIEFVTEARWVLSEPEPDG